MCVLIRRDTNELALSPHEHTKGHVSPQQDDSHLLAQEKRPQHEIYLADILVIDLPAYRTMINKFLSFKSPYLWYFVVKT